VAQRVGRGIAVLFRDRGTRRGWVVSSTPRPHFIPGKDPVPILQEAGWAPGPVWRGGKSSPLRDSIPDRPARSHSLYRLSYRALLYLYIYIYIYIKVNWSGCRPGVAQRVGRGIALLFRDRGTRRGWVVSSTPRPYFTPEKDPVPIVQEAGWAPGPVWRGGKSRPRRDSIPDRPAHSQSLCRLSYPAHLYIYIKVKWSGCRPGVAQRVGRGIALLFRDRGTRRGWVVSSTPRPHFTPGKDPVPILQEGGCASGPVWTGGKSRPHRDSIPDRPARSQSLYRLSYQAHNSSIKIFNRDNTYGI